MGEYEKGDFLLTHAWPGFYDKSAFVRWTEGPASRSAYVFAFRTEPAEGDRNDLPNYSPIGNAVASYLSVLYGKRFDNHGLTEESGFFHIPDLSQFESLCNPTLPHNSYAPRADYPIPLNLVEFARIEPILLRDSLAPNFVQTFQGAAKFYLQALQNSEREPEVAYLHLITAGEILSNFNEFDKGTLLDEQIKTDLQIIREQLPNGTAMASRITAKILLIKKRFVQTITSLVDPAFFDRSESKEQFGRFKSASFEETVGAAYDLRSKYVHTGIPFGIWVSFNMGGRNPEIHLGQPVVSDKSFQKILMDAPTLIGLERIIRYCLLRFAEANGGYINAVSNSAKSS
ncbi:MAG TPA: hypothetical protein VLX91_07355 [Candidatus Acidoferrales bacterium]|nr:hypothetical protein [Candidatus Acidoferrales bacterium]